MNLRRAFTLIELLIVVAIIGVLAVIVALLSVNHIKSAQDSARKANLREVANALEAYYVDNNNKYPPDTSVNTDNYFASSGNNWIPGLAPGEIKTLPDDPKQSGLINFLADRVYKPTEKISKLLSSIIPLKFTARAASSLVQSQSQICSILGTNQTNVGIGGQDGGTSLLDGSTTYWTFGDTVHSIGQFPFIPNNSAYSSDLDASNCITMTSKSSSGTATALFNKVTGEVSAWPDGMVKVSSLVAHFFYSSVKPCVTCESETFTSPPPSWKVQGIGLGEFVAGSNMNSGRVDFSGSDPSCTTITDCLLWSEADGATNGFQIAGATATLDSGYVYVFLDETSNDNATGAGIDQHGVRLARVAANAASVQNKSAYQYWNGTGWVSQLKDSARIMSFDSEPGGFNGVSVAFNSFLNKWTAIYTTNNFSEVAMRVADTITGPWTTTDEVLVDCTAIFSGQWLPCYYGRQHPEYSPDGGKTIYVTYANHVNYKVYLHKIIFSDTAPTWWDTTPPPPPPPANSCDGDGQFYCYYVNNDRTSYQLWAKLEDSNDGQIWDQPKATCKLDPKAIFGSTTKFNYCISSSQ